MSVRSDVSTAVQHDKRVPVANSISSRAQVFPDPGNVHKTGGFVAEGGSMNLRTEYFCLQYASVSGASGCPDVLGAGAGAGATMCGWSVDGDDETGSIEAKGAAVGLGVGCLSCTRVGYITASGLSLMCG